MNDECLYETEIDGVLIRVHPDGLYLSRGDESIYVHSYYLLLKTMLGFSAQAVLFGDVLNAPVAK